MPPRNYKAIPVASPPNRDPSLQPHDRLLERLCTGAVRLEIFALTPVFPGSGTFMLDDAAPADRSVVQAPATRDGVAVIPGSSIKGSCRQAHEAITASASPFTRDTRGPSAGLFGSLQRQGRVSFDDAVPVDAEGQPLPELELQRIRLSGTYSPKNGNRWGRRFYGPQKPDADQPPRLPSLAIPSGTRLHTTLRFRNAQPYELGALFLALGMAPESADRFSPKLGGGKYDRFGWVRVTPVAYRLHAPLRIGRVEWIDDPKKVAACCRKAMKAARELLPPAGQAALATLRETLQPSGEQEATP